MKAILLVIGFSLVGCGSESNGDMWSTLQPGAAYEVKAGGLINPEFLEFTPVGNPGYFCVIVTDTLEAMFCMPKAKRG